MKDAKIKVVAMPRNTDGRGNIKAGWMMEQIDLAAGIAVKEFTGSRSVTVSINEIVFKEPVLIGDYLLFYADITSVGKSSINVAIDIDLQRLDENGFSLHKNIACASAIFVSLDKDGKKIIISDELKKKLES